MTTAAEVIAKAWAEIGTTEGPEPNRVKYNNWFYKRDNAYGETYAWCHVFVSWVFAQLDAAELFPFTSRCATGEKWFRDKGQWISDPKKFLPGDAVYFNFSHIEIFVKDNGDGTFTSVGGNTNSAGSRSGGQVYANSRRHYKDVKGAGRPLYSGVPKKKSFKLAGPIAAGVLATALGVGVGTLGLGNVSPDKVLTPGTSVTVAPEVVVPTTIPTQTPVPAPPKAPSTTPAKPPVSQAAPPVSVPQKATSYRQGAKGPKVRIIQRKVGVKADGDFGPRTKAAVIKYQKKHGLVADGIVGKRTLAKMGIS